ncbi:MAG: hypothetical protein L0Z62_01080 [Gemmataceae bacterium]|nr:hypothetical protein [Gemmataceae bacterium]
MTLIDLIRVGSVKTEARAEALAADLIDAWHNDELAGELNDILGLSPREYQAWTTGGGFAAHHRELAPQRSAGARCEQTLVQAVGFAGPREGRLFEREAS